MMMMMSMMITLISSFMLFLNNPLSMGLMILIQTILICLITGMMIKTYWFSYILFLILLGGLLVMFIYVSSIASNELFLTSFNMKFYFYIMMLSLMLMLLMMYVMKNNLINTNFSFNSDMDKLINLKNLFINKNLNKINLNKFYNNQTFMMTIMLMIYMFITLIAVVKITNIFYGPLRSKF
uniref:NADH-ubiquinone oxidoreductase chain 6 n=1 Tax=Lymantria sinica TaxID=871320 RepID=A0A8F9RYW2_9NEOP|nr:NADH dehydrogenase subunit 6 [Lymantria sinica]